jgi:hydrogenase nickel incorporation protein HypA/HybF
MHEMSIMQSVFDAATSALSDSGETRVTKLSLTVGEMTEIIESALQFAFAALKPDTALRDAQLEITFLEPKSHCLDCDKTFEHDRYNLICPFCGSAVTSVVQGREMLISALEADSEPFRSAEEAAKEDPFASLLSDTPTEATPSFSALNPHDTSPA